MAKVQRKYLTMVSDKGKVVKFYLSEVSGYTNNKGNADTFTYIGTSIYDLIYPYIGKPDDTITWTIQENVQPPAFISKIRFTIKQYDAGRVVRADYLKNSSVIGNTTWYQDFYKNPYGKLYLAVTPGSQYLMECRTDAAGNEAKEVGQTVNNSGHGSCYLPLSNFHPADSYTQGGIPPGKFPGDDNSDDPEGGDGDGPEGIEDDPIEAPEDPSISAVDSGLLTLYTPTLNQIHEFGNFLWSDLFSLDTFKKLFSDPMQAVIGLSALPISVPSSGAQNIIIGSVDSGVSANRASKQFVRKDCGTIHIKPTWNTALDYEPYTKFSIFLPYIGTRELKTDDIMDKDINVSYLIDILSGSCTAHIKVGGSVLYQFSGSCAVPIPVTGTSWNNLLTSCIQLAGAGIVTAASGGAASAALAGGMAAAGTANMVANSKPNIQRTGAVSGAAGMLGVQTPYLIRETPRQSLAKGYNKFVGYPSNITSKLGDLKGYTQVENIHLENLSCTADEAAEIESLLKEGVII